MLDYFDGFLRRRDLDYPDKIKRICMDSNLFRAKLNIESNRNKRYILHSINKNLGRQITADIWLSMRLSTARKSIELMLLSLFYLLYHSRLNGNFLLVFQINQFVRTNSNLINLNDFIRLFKIFVQRESLLDKITEIYFLISIHPKFSVRNNITLNNYLKNKGRIQKWDNLRNRGKR